MTDPWFYLSAVLLILVGVSIALHSARLLRRLEGGLRAVVSMTVGVVAIQAGIILLIVGLTS